MTRPATGRAPARRARPGPRQRAAAVPVAVGDLARRLHDAQRALRPRLVTRSALAHIVQSTHATLDPRRVAEFLVSWAPTWWPVSIWAVVTTDVDGQLAVLAQRGLPESLASTAQAVAGWMVHSGEDFGSADLRYDSRLAAPAGGSAVAAIGFVLRGREQVIGALIGFDRRASESEPALNTGVRGAWASLVTTGAIDAAAFLAAHGEIYATFSKVQPFIDELRAASGEPDFCKHIETVLLTDPDAQTTMARRRQAIRAAVNATGGSVSDPLN